MGFNLSLDTLVTVGTIILAVFTGYIRVEKRISKLEHTKEEYDILKKELEHILRNEKAMSNEVSHLSLEISELKQSIRELAHIIQSNTTHTTNSIHKVQEQALNLEKDFLKCDRCKDKTSKSSQNI